ncbi:hypothetical protein AWV80_34745 [Cupriavidus sp. UYMU48A]|nr:hypothetical protein AWV80_34745 [Cupriavidus sp. UYMU48A]
MERELKFEFASGKDAGLRDLPTLLDLKIDAPTEQMLESEYFDTPDSSAPKWSGAARPSR